MHRLCNRIAATGALLVAIAVLTTFSFGSRDTISSPNVESAAFCPINFKAEGSTTVYPIGVQAEAPFEALWNPGTDMLLASTGSGAGITALTATTIDVAHSSRPLTANEANGKYVFKVALDGFAIMVKDDPAMAFISNITVAQLNSIYSVIGLEWNDLDGSYPARPIVPRARILVSGSQPDFLGQIGVSLAAEAAVITATGLPRLTESSDMAAAAAGNVDHIVYSSLANDGLAGTKTLTVNGIALSKTTVQNGTYPIKRQLFVATRNNAQVPRIDNSAQVRADDYIQYLRSPAGEAIADAVGFVEIPSGEAIPDWDVNLDGTTSLGDLGAVAAKWGQSSTCKGWIRADAQNNGTVSLADIGTVTNKWGLPGFVCAGNPCNP